MPVFCAQKDENGPWVVVIFRTVFALTATVDLLFVFELEYLNARFLEYYYCWHLVLTILMQNFTVVHLAIIEPSLAEGVSSTATSFLKVFCWCRKCLVLTQD